LNVLSAGGRPADSYNGDFARGYVDDALLLDGVDDVLILSDDPSLDIRGDMTLSLWAKRTGFGGSATLISIDAGHMLR
jgi:hypothetical protein